MGDSIPNQKSSPDNLVMYNMVMLLAGQSQIKRRVLITLAHIYPHAISGVQLTKLIGLSVQAGSLYRGVLKDLEKEKMVLLDHLTPRLYSIRINHEHTLLKEFVALCQSHGQPLSEKLQILLEDTNPQ